MSEMTANILFKFSSEEKVNMHFYGFCYDNATAAVEECW
jgi:hypothetical protein